MISKALEHVVWSNIPPERQNALLETAVQSFLEDPPGLWPVGPYRHLMGPLHRLGFRIMFHGLGHNAECVYASTDNQALVFAYHYPPPSKPSLWLHLRWFWSFLLEVGLWDAWQSYRYIIPRFTDYYHGLDEQQSLFHREQASPFLFLFVISVNPSLQGQGIGSQLIRQVAAYADLHRLAVYLEATSEQSVRLYERYGFQRIRDIRPTRSPPLQGFPQLDVAPPMVAMVRPRTLAN